MKKLLLGLGMIFGTIVNSSAQVNYSFAASAGTYTPISGTPVTISVGGEDGAAGTAGMDEGYNNAVPIGFNFNFNGSATNYSTIGFCTNGFLYLGSNVTGTTTGLWQNNLNTGLSAIRPIIAPLWDDFEITGASYSTTGSVGSRVFTIQWEGIYWRFTATAPSMDMQVKLYEGSNRIEFIYNQLPGATATPTASIGLAATASGAFMSLNNATAAPTASTSVETASISAKPATGQVYAFTPVAQAANDIAITAVYPLGKVGRYMNQTVRAYVRNNGTNAATNLPITISVAGANSYTSTITIASIPAGAAGTVSFPAFHSLNTGTNTITVSVPSDDVNTNNSSSANQEVTLNRLAYNSGTTPSGGVNAGQGNEIAVKLAVPAFNSLTQVSAYFSAASISYDLIIYDNVSGLPGTALGSVTAQTSTLGLNNITLPSAINITDTFFIAIKQNGTSLSLSYELEAPPRSGAYFLKSGVNPWFDLGGNPANTFRPMLEAVFATNLPVELSSFTGVKVNGVNKLSWNTATELNNSGFELQRSADGKNFTKLAFVNSKSENGNSASPLSYTFVDENPLRGANYYRLNQVDKDGKSTLSEIVTIKGDKVSKLEVSAIFPNPVKDRLTVKIEGSASEKVSVQVVDLAGKVLSVQNVQVGIGENQISVNTSKLTNGNYILKVTTENGETSVQKFVKQ